MYDVTQGIPLPTVSSATADTVNLVIRINGMADAELAEERDALIRRFTNGERVDREVLDIVRNIAARRGLS